MRASYHTTANLNKCSAMMMVRRGRNAAKTGKVNRHSERTGPEGASWLWVRINGRA